MVWSKSTVLQRLGEQLIKYDWSQATKTEKELLGSVAEIKGFTIEYLLLDIV